MATGEPSGTTRIVSIRPFGGTTGHIRNLIRGALLDWNLTQSIVDTEVDRGRRQCNIEWNAIIVRRERFQIRPNLVANVSIGRDPIRTDDDKINHAMLHQMTAGIVRDNRVRDALMSKFPSR